MEIIGLILSMQDAPCSRPEEEGHMELKSLSNTNGMGRCKALWVIRESETSSQNAGSAVSSLYLDTAGSHGCRREGAETEGVKCDTKITTCRVINMSLLCTYLFKVASTVIKLPSKVNV